jgi:hypothetical protein
MGISDKRRRKKNKGTYKKNTAMSEDEFRQKFRTETAARKYLEKTIWQGKRVCPYCGSKNTKKW